MPLIFQVANNQVNPNEIIKFHRDLPDRNDPEQHIWEAIIKPIDGIPEEELSAGVQTKLNRSIIDNHDDLSNIGINTHEQIDNFIDEVANHIDDGTIHTKILYGTDDPPSAAGLINGTIYIKYQE